MFELKAQMYFAAAHHLLNYEGECENQHGHNWLVEAYVKGETLDKSNILVDYKVLKRELKAVLDLLDHKDINELPYFKGESPSSEMISMFIYNQLKERGNLSFFVNNIESKSSNLLVPSDSSAREK